MCQIKIPKDYDNCKESYDDKPLYNHDFLGENHIQSEIKTWAVILLCSISMLLELSIGMTYGSLALVVDAIHMSTHVLSFLISAIAYTVARKLTNDPRFVFGTGKIGDLSAFSSAIILFIVSLIIFYDGINRLLYPTFVDFNSTIPVAIFGLFVNLLSGIILSGSFCSPKGICRCTNIFSDSNTVLDSDRNDDSSSHAGCQFHSHGPRKNNYTYLLNDNMEEMLDDDVESGLNNGRSRKSQGNSFRHFY